MKLSVALTALACLAAIPAAVAAPPKWAMVIHGGAGVIERKELSAEQEAAYRAAMTQAAQIGSDVLKRGGTSLDAIEATIRFMEDDPKFNAGRGAVFTAAGRNELDSSIMDGKTLSVGAVAGATRTRHPISLARTVMEKSSHVMMIGAGADSFAKQQGLEQVEPGWFYTETRWKALEKYLTERKLPIPPKPPGIETSSTHSQVGVEDKKGTVGVVALDSHGNVAAGTSTGGMTGKRWGRVGDSPIIGAGTYASNSSCAVSATGDGEYFIRLTVAREICALVQYKGMKLQAAADEVIQKRLTALGGEGGIVALTPDGQMAWSFNSPGMYRARTAEGQPILIGIFKDEQ